mmetsp:Transcript_107930/g.344538  ORF Transcript_107930/g.344538 Transcript_107930/m.344538 type:complete len:302 (-) Transcript_107930:2821-3726(-)
MPICLCSGTAGMKLRRLANGNSGPNSMLVAANLRVEAAAAGRLRVPISFQPASEQPCASKKHIVSTSQSLDSFEAACCPTNIPDSRKRFMEMPPVAQLSKVSGLNSTTDSDVELSKMVVLSAEPTAARSNGAHCDGDGRSAAVKRFRTRTVEHWARSQPVALLFPATIRIVGDRQHLPDVLLLDTCVAVESHQYDRQLLELTSDTLMLSGLQMLPPRGAGSRESISRTLSKRSRISLPYTWLCSGGKISGMPRSISASLRMPTVEIRTRIDVTTTTAIGQCEVHVARLNNTACLRLNGMAC